MMGIQIIKFEEWSGIKRVQTENGEPVEYEILYESDMPDNDEAYDCWGNKVGQK
jgi:hypothetical protein